MKYTNKDAVLSECKKYRYMLRRVWDRTKPACLFIGLNPSTADATVDDPTIRRCVGFADSWGYGELVVGNLYAFRATKPKDMFNQDDPVGPFNDLWLKKMGLSCEIIIAAWGANGALSVRGRDVKKLMPAQMYHLGLTKAGQPKHPLYLKADTRPELFCSGGYRRGCNN